MAPPRPPSRRRGGDGAPPKAGPRPGPAHRARPAPEANDRARPAPEANDRARPAPEATNSARNEADDPNRKGGPSGPTDGRKARAGNSRRGATQQRRRAFLALGSNLGDRRHHLASAIARIPDLVAVSPIYETDPVGGPAGQGAYLNCVVELHTTRTPRELLIVAQAAEAAARRVRLERWGPRTLDVDVLLVGDETVDEPDLIVPHPRMWARGFVLVPLGDLAPELVSGRLTPELAAGVRPAGTL